MPNPTLGRDVLTQFLPDHQAIKAFEKVLDDVGSALPSQIDAATNAADSAGAAAASALALLQQIAGALDALLMAPASAQPTYADDFTRATYAGTLAAQDYDHVDITGGTIGLDSGAVGTPSLYLNGEKTTGLYRIGIDHWGMAIAGVKLADYSAAVLAVTGDVTATNQLKSTVSTGTPPLVVASTDEVANLHAATTTKLATARTIGGVSFDGTSNITVAYSTAAFTVGTDLTVQGAFGCNGASIQGSYSLGAAATDPATTMALANSMRTMLINNGIGAP